MGLAAGCDRAWSQQAAPAEPAASQAAPPAQAETPRAVDRPLALSVDATAAATNNGGLDDSGRRQHDFITSIRPELAVSHDAPGFSADVHAGATFIDYASGSQPNGVLPTVHGNFKSTLVDRWLYLDANAYVRSAEADAFGVRSDDVLGANRHVESGFLIGPALRHDFSSNVSVLARDQFAGVRNSAADGTWLRSNLTQFHVERKPTPLGVSADLSRLENGAGDRGDSHYTLTTARLRGALIVGGDVEIGAVAGQDRSEYLSGRHSDPLYGSFIEWAPGPRTRFELELEHRFFGQSGKLRFNHRMPFLAVSVSVRREPVDVASSFGTLVQGNDLRTALDSILTTRYPDASVRAGMVDSAIESSGLAPQSAGAVNVLGDYPQLQTALEGALTLLGSVDALSLSAYGVTTRVLPRAGAPLPGGGTVVADTRQRGATVQLEHRLGPQVSASLMANWSRIEGLAASAGDASTEQTWRASVLRHLSPRSDLTLAIQWYRFATTAPGRQPFDATLGLVGIHHRF